MEKRHFFPASLPVLPIFPVHTFNPSTYSTTPEPINFAAEFGLHIGLKLNCVLQHFQYNGKLRARRIAALSFNHDLFFGSMRGLFSGRDSIAHVHHVHAVCPSSLPSASGVA